MMIDKHVRRNYPKLVEFVEKELPRIRKRSRVWRAFKKYSELKEGEAVSAVKRGHYPSLRSWKLPGRVNGRYSGKRYPNNVFLATIICKKFERDYKKKKARQLVESTILHEIVHWGDYKDGKKQSKEAGKQFEKAAYGKDIKRYW